MRGKASMQQVSRPEAYPGQSDVQPSREAAYDPRKHVRAADIREETDGLRTVGVRSESVGWLYIYTPLVVLPLCARRPRPASDQWRETT